MTTSQNKKLTLTREALRSLTSDELRLVAGGVPGMQGNGGGRPTGVCRI